MAQMKIRGNTQIIDGSIDLPQLGSSLKSLIYSGIDTKDSVRVATTVNIVLSGTQTIDGVALSAGNRVLVKSQTAPAENGIYVVAAGAWARATDADTSDEVTTGLQCYVSEGATNLGSVWTLITNAPIVIGTTALTFTQTGGMSVAVAGDGLVASGNALNVNPGDGIQLVADQVRVKLDTVPGLEFISGGLRVDADETTIERVAGGIQLKDGGVSNLKIRDSAALSVIGRYANSVGNPADIVAGADGYVMRRSGTTIGFGTIATAGHADNSVTYAKLQDISATARLLGRKSAGAGNAEEIVLDATTTPLLGSNLEIAANGIRVTPSPKVVSIYIDAAGENVLLNGDGSWGLHVNAGVLVDSAYAIKNGTFDTNLQTETLTASRGLVLPDRNGTLVLRSDLVAEEAPSGTINGANTAFTLANTPIAGTVILYLNGIRLRSGAGNDFTIAGTAITMLYAPQTGDVLLATYLK